MKNREIHSFDLWDTLITRLVCDPKDIFYIIEKNEHINGFRDIRVEAEAAARRNNLEVSIFDIYHSHPFLKDRADELINLELTYEKKLASGITSQICDISKEDIIVSDMYWPSSDLREICRNISEKLNDPALMVSSDFGKTKAKGTLYSEVLSHFDVKHHIGDNFHSDYVMAKRSGLSAVHYRESAPNELERRWCGLDGDIRFVGGIIRASRLACPYANEDEISTWNLYSGVIGPWLTGYVLRILRECKGRGIKKIFFLSRDGQIPYLIAKKINEHFSFGLDCRYIYASRKLLQMPGYIDIKDASSWIFVNYGTLDINIIEARTGISKEILGHIWAEENIPVLGNISDDHVEKLIRNRKFLDALREHSDELLELIIPYYKSAGLIGGDGGDVAIVDAGWNGRMQLAISNIKVKLSDPGRVVGYYLGANDGFAISEKDLVNGYMYSTFDQSRVYNWAKKYITLIENILVADHPSVLGIQPSDSTGIKWIFQSEMSSRDARDVEVKQSAVDSFVTNLCKFINLYSLELGGKFESKSIEEFYKFVSCPEGNQVTPFLYCRHSPDGVGKFDYSLVKKVRFRDFVFRKTGFFRVGWKEGTLAISGFTQIYRIAKFFQGLI